MNRSNRILLPLWSLLILLLTLYSVLRGGMPTEVIARWVTANLGVGLAEGYGFLFFSLMGLWPVAFILLYARRGGDWKPRPWGFVAGAFVAGAYVLGFWFILRRPAGSGETAPGKPAGRRLRYIGFPLLVATAAVLAVFALPRGDAGAFRTLWRSSAFLPVMGFDFLLFAAFFITEAVRFGRSRQPGEA